MNRVSGNYPRETLIKTSVMVGKMFMVESHESQDGGVQVSYMVAVYRGLMPELIGFTITRSRLHSSTGQPVGKTVRVMIAPVIGPRQLALAIDRTPEFATPHDKGVLKHAPLLKVREKSSRGLIGILALSADVPGGSPVGIPAPMEKLDEAHAPFRQASGKQAIVSVLAHFANFRTIGINHRFGFTRKID